MSQELTRGSQYTDINICIEFCIGVISNFDIINNL